MPVTLYLRHGFTLDLVSHFLTEIWDGRCWHSVQAMQSIIDICESFAVDYDMKFNCDKSVAMRIGLRYNCICADLTLCNKPLAYVTSVKYLGVYISVGSTFQVFL